jgi:hypothetical protein
MIKILCFIIVMIAFEVQSVDVVNNPVDVRLHSFCTIEKECKISVTFINQTPYAVRFNSYYTQGDKISPSSILAFDAEKYNRLEVSGKRVYESQIVSTEKTKRRLGSINLEPYQTIFYELTEIEDYFNFDINKDYLVKLYIPHASVYVNNNFTGTISIKSNFGEITFPTVNSELK